MMKQLLILTSFLFVLSVFAQTPPPATPPAPAQPSTPPPPTAPASPAPAAPVDIEFLLDASGSMSAMVGPESQMEIAKKAIKETIKTIPSNVTVALRVYAHRIPKSDKEGSCKDTELLIPFKPVDAASFATTVDPIKPNGYTPIAFSLRAAANDFLGKESQHVIILLSDGEETCGGDPVAEAKNLLAQGFKVTIHTIGFRVDEKTKAQLAAISNATGGSYFDAKDAASLIQNLAQATQRALLISKPAEQARGQEIRGGNQYGESVPLQPGIEYRLDHHQRRDQYDYFYVDVKKGQSLTITMMTMDKGISITSANQAKENENPYAGFRVMDSQFQEITKGSVIGGRHGKEQRMIVANKDERLYILIGSSYDNMHKDSPFQLEIKNHFDASTGEDAGEEIINPLEVLTQEYPENWLTTEKDVDYFKINANANQAYTITVTPQNMDPYLRLEIYDHDRVRIFYDSGPNPGAVVRVENAVPKADGPLYLKVSGYSFRNPVQYALNIKAGEKPAGGGAAPTAPQTTTTPTTGAATPGPGAQTDPTQAPPDAQKKQGLTPGQNNITLLYVLLILAGLIILGLIGVVMVLLLKRKS